MHKLAQMIKDVNRTHKQLGQLVAMNMLAAKAKKTILNVAPSGCGKSVASQSSANMLQERAKYYTSLTLAGLVHLKKEISNYDGHIMIDDLGAEKSTWSRIEGSKNSNDELSSRGMVLSALNPSGLTFPYINHHDVSKPRLYALCGQNHPRRANICGRIRRLSLTQHPTSPHEQPRARRRLGSCSTGQSHTILPPLQTNKTTKLPTTHRPEMGQTHHRNSLREVKRQIMVSTRRHRLNPMGTLTHLRAYTRPITSVCIIRREGQSKCN